MLTISGATRIVVDEATETEGDLVIVDGRVAAVGDQRVSGSEVGRGAAAGGDRVSGSDARPEVLDATGAVVTPGLVNAHHHLLQCAFRTLPGTRGVPMADWLGVMGAAYRRVGVDAELTGAAAAVGLAEALLSGVTTLADHHLTWPVGGDPAALAAATAAAARRLGARLVFVHGSAGNDPQSAAAAATEVVQRLLPEVHRRVQRGVQGGVQGGIADDGMLQLAIGPAGVHSDPRETFELFGQVAERFGLARRTQANEQVDVEVAARRYGRRPLDLLQDWGWLEPGVTVAHLCEVTDDEISRVAAAGITATHAPGCDVPMGWGIAPVARLRAAGVMVGLGTSGGGSNDAGHLLADARLAMQVSALAGPPLAAREVLAMATAGSAAGLGRSELGQLRVGAAGDACVWDVSGAADAGVADPVAGLLWAAPGRRPRHVVVGGRVVVRDHRLVEADESELVAALRARLR